MDSNDKIKAVGVNIQEKANLIWNVANSLFGAYKPHEYGLVILPMVVINVFTIAYSLPEKKCWRHMKE